jgi:HEAT repeat protein
MEAANAFARHFAQLVWLIREDPADIDGQKASLRALVTSLATTAVELDTVDDALNANGSAVLDVSSCMSTLVEQMTALGVTTITAEDHTPPRDLLESARLLARAGTSQAARVDLPATAGPIRLTRRIRAPATTSAFQPPIVAAEERAREADVESSAAAPSASLPPPATFMAEPPEGMLDRSTAAYEHYSALAPSVLQKVDRLLEELATEAEGERLLSVLTKLTTVAEHASNEGRMALAVRVVGAVVARQGQLTHPRARRAFELTMFRLAQPAMLRAVAERLPHAGDDRAPLVAALAAAGEEGADAVIEQLVAAAERRDRRVYFDTLLQLKSGIPTLLHMLGDARWYVVRNAAELLGELRVRQAEAPLCELLQHPEERVRRSASVALVRVGGGRGMQAVIDALGDGSPDVRIQAGAALASRPGPQVSAALLRALDEERDERVLAAHLLSLGRLATPDAVQRLIGYAAPRRGLFRPNAMILRLAAVDGLAKVKTPAAKQALTALEEDVEQAVRDAAAAARSR